MENERGYGLSTDKTRFPANPHTELDGSGIFLGSQQDAVRFDVPMNDVILVTVTHCF